MKEHKCRGLYDPGPERHVIHTDTKTTNLDAEVIGNVYQNPELGEIHKREYGSN